ncbi:MAG: flotillin-like protein FloA [Chthoniobacteraceae bacterium]
MPENLPAGLSTGVVVLIGVALLVAFIFVVVMFNFIGIWVRARVANAPVGLFNMLAMRLRRVPVGMIVDNRITAVKAGIEIPTDPLEAHYLAGGNVDQVILALIAADKAGIPLDFNRACAIDLATKGTGKTVLEAVRTSINPKVIDCPNAAMGRTTIDGVAKDGIGVKVKARVTVRSHLDRFVGGATEETIIARVGEGIVSAIGSADSYKDVMENPDRISKAVLAKGLDSNTAFEILSIDIADVDVGENIGAKLQTEQADADKRVAQANAEVRRAAAVAVEQEMRAKTQEMRAKVVEAESLVPQAMAEAFRSGNLGIMDYMRMKNIESDTQMRGAIAGNDPSRTENKQ